MLDVMPIFCSVSCLHEFLDVVARIPRGKVMSYGDIAEYLAEGGPRQVAKVMSSFGDQVPWHRVLRANGTCADEVRDRQLQLLRAEPVTFDGSGTRVRMQESRWTGTATDTHELEPTKGLTRRSARGRCRD